MISAAVVSCPPFNSGTSAAPGRLRNTTPDDIVDVLADDGSRECPLRTARVVA